MQPDTRYALSGDVNIAYQVVGSGPLDLVLVPGWVSHLDLLWEDPAATEWVRRLKTFSRVILFDKRGTGLSDLDVGESTLEDRMDDLRAVLDAAGSDRAALFGLSEGGPLAMLFAATYPERARELVLCATFARATEAPDYPEGVAMRAALDHLRHAVEHAWGRGTTLAVIAPSLKDDERVRSAFARFERAAVSPRAGRAHLSWIYDIDVRPVARALQVPTLILHRVGDRLVPVVSGRWLARNVPGARFVELPGDEHAPWLGDTSRLVDEMQQFLTGSRAPVATERVLATVLFTDIVGSTERAVALGDCRWGDLRERHHALVRRELALYRGREIETAGDSFLATFDGPARAIRCACDVRDIVRQLGLSIRAGVHTGECELTDDKIGGIAVHIGARVVALAGPDEVLVSSTVKDLVAGSGLRFTDRGSQTLKGVPGEWRLYAVEP